MEQEEHFFDFAAEVGFTKHIGSVEATRQLAALCHIGKGSYVLDVGCGAGATPVYLAQQVGCTVVGVDILPRMVARAAELAARAGVAARTAFRVADAQALPFDDDTFDAVITESVTAFPADKQLAVNEYVRVTKPGGYVGLNETTWLQTPPPPEVIAWAEQEVGAQAKPLAAEAWLSLLQEAGLHDPIAHVYEISVRDEAKGMMSRYGVGGMLRVWGRTLRLYLRNPTYRQFVSSVRQRGVTPENLTTYLGYGLFVGRKRGSAATHPQPQPTDGDNQTPAGAR